MRVARVWAKAGLQPHRVRSYMASDDPEFEKKAADVIGLYLKPPVNAVVFCVDEKTAIQALDRLSPGRAERHGFEYFRHGTLSRPEKYWEKPPVNTRARSLCRILERNDRRPARA
jgi:hypothetical protein